MKTHSKKALVYWLPCAIVITILVGFTYLAVQQDMRQTANDPQIQVAEDIATALGQGQPPQAIIPQNGPTDLSTTLSTYVVIYDSTGKALAYSATEGGNAPSLPADVFAYAKAHQEDRITWQPQPGTREAIVVTYYNGGGQSGFVMAGRSLREVEKRENALGIEALIAWLVALIISLAACMFLLHPRGEIFVTGIIVEKVKKDSDENEED